MAMDLKQHWILLLFWGQFGLTISNCALNTYWNSQITCTKDNLGQLTQIWDNWPKFMCFGGSLGQST